MKNKKIMAGLALGVMGSALLTGCAMSDEQQAALDKVVNKADQIIELVEKNNKKITKEEGVLLHKYAVAKLQLNKDNVWDNLIVDTEFASQDGDFHAESHLFKLANGKNVAYMVQDEEILRYCDSDQEAGRTVTEGNSGDGSMSMVTILPSFEFYAYGLVVGTDGGISIEVNENNLVDCVILDNGNYKLTCVGESDELGDCDAEYLYECEISEDGTMYSMDYTILYKDSIEGGYEIDYFFNKAAITFKYGELTESIVQANIDAYNASQQGE